VGGEDAWPGLTSALETGKLQSCALGYHEFIRLQAQALKEVEASERMMPATP
jgi:hypothetical protein